MLIENDRTEPDNEIGTMPAISAGIFHVYYIYDVSDTIDLKSLMDGNGDRHSGKTSFRPISLPSHCFQFATAPIESELGSIDCGNATGSLRLKVYDYGTISLRASFPLEGDYENVLQSTAKLRQSEVVAKHMEFMLQEFLKMFGAALRQPHKPLLEEYFVVEINGTRNNIASAQILESCGPQLACLLQAESKLLTPLEQEDVLRSRFSYFENDLVLITWDSAVIYETRENAESIESILEFANTQLVELRTYDRRLDSELDEIYKWDMLSWHDRWLFGGRTAQQRISRVRKLLVDIRELSDRSNNALKIIGDAYYARLYRSIAARLGISDWQKQVDSKLSSIQGICQFATEQALHARSDFLEVVIIFLIVLEIFLGLIGRSH